MSSSKRHRKMFIWLFEGAKQPTIEQAAMELAKLIHEEKPNQQLIKLVSEYILEFNQQEFNFG